MWQYIKGVKPPTQKRKLDEEEKKQHSADYEKKRQRKYDRKWEETFPWLSTNDDGKMICRPCIDYPTLSDKDCSLDMPREALMKKLVGFGSNRAAVMTGVNNGVVTMFKREQPCLQAIH